MKRYIKANRHLDNSNERLEQIAATAQALADAIQSESDEQLRRALKDQGRYFQKLDRPKAIKALLDNLSYLQKDYESEVAKSQAYPNVQADLVEFLRSLGYSMKKVNGRLEWGDEGWVIIPADECEFKDINIVCKQISDQFDNKWDTPLSGSWTGHGSEIDGVRFHVSFERDYDYDPSGKERSLILYF